MIWFSQGQGSLSLYIYTHYTHPSPWCENVYVYLPKRPITKKRRSLQWCKRTHLCSRPGPVFFKSTQLQRSLQRLQRLVSSACKDLMAPTNASWSQPGGFSSRTDTPSLGGSEFGVQVRKRKKETKRARCVHIRTYFMMYSGRSLPILSFSAEREPKIPSLPLRKGMGGLRPVRDTRNDIFISTGGSINTSLLI